MSNYLWCLDAGHGGIDKDGNYTTAPAKMHTFSDFTIHEGVINRRICEILYKELELKAIDFALVYHDVEDTPLHKRVEIADSVFRKDNRAIYLSVHSNAGGGSGFEIFTSPGQTKSDKVANVFAETYQKFFPQFAFRKDYSDGDWDKEANFYVLRKTDCPALLVENLFFDRRPEAVYLSSEEGQRNIAKCIVQCIENVEKLKPI